MACSSARNVVARLFATYNPHEKIIIAQQIPVEMFGYLRGTVEFSQDYLIDLNNVISELDSFVDEVNETSETLRRVYPTSKDSKIINYSKAKESALNVRNSFLIMKRCLNQVNDLLFSGIDLNKTSIDNGSILPKALTDQKIMMDSKATVTKMLKFIDDPENAIHIIDENIT